jgi:hypothetical protein
MYGLTDKPAKELLPLARSWNNPPYITNTKGCSSLGYKHQERAYHLAALSDKMGFELAANAERSVFNPCFVIKDWSGDAIASLKINGRDTEQGKDFRQGIIVDTQGSKNKVIWVKHSSDSPVTFDLKKQ